MHDSLRKETPLLRIFKAEKQLSEVKSKCRAINERTSPLKRHFTTLSFLPSIKL